MFKPYFLLPILALIQACSLAPSYERPDTAAQHQKNFHGAPETLETIIDKTKWWQAYPDETLDETIQTLLSDNLNLKAAAERVTQARERIAVQRGGLFPQISASLGASRSRQPLSASSIAFSEASYNTAYQAGLDASWQLDLFGRIRSSVDAAQFQALASNADQIALAQTLIGDLLNRKIAIASLIHQIEITQNTIENLERTYAVVKRGYESGTSNVTSLDVKRAKENLATTTAQLPAQENALITELFAYYVLLGLTPGRGEATEKERATAFPIKIQPTPFILPPPVSLLSERPDLLAREARLKAANADIGTAIADLYPDLGLQGGYGFSDETTNDLISPEKIAWNIAASLMQSLFEGGRLRANIRLQEAEARELVYSYSQSVLEAIQEVETALANEQNLREQTEQLEESTALAKSAYRDAEKRYQKGILPVTELLTVQSRYFQAQQQYIQTLETLWRARNALHLALGGP